MNSKTTLVSGWILASSPQQIDWYSISERGIKLQTLTSSNDIFCWTKRRKPLLGCGIGNRWFVLGTPQKRRNWWTCGEVKWENRMRLIDKLIIVKDTLDSCLDIPLLPLLGSPAKWRSGRQKLRNTKGDGQKQSYNRERSSDILRCPFVGNPHSELSLQLVLILIL